MEHAAFISLERNNIPLAKFLGQAYVYFGIDQKLGKNNRIWGKLQSISSKSFCKVTHMHHNCPDQPYIQVSEFCEMWGSILQLNIRFENDAIHIYVKNIMNRFEKMSHKVTFKNIPVFLKLLEF